MSLLPHELARKTQLVGIQKSASAYVLVKLCPRLTKPTLLLCSDDDEARIFLEDLRFFARFLGETDTQFHWLPAWESGAYRKLSPSLSYRFERLRTLHACTQQTAKKTFVVSTAQALLQAAIPQSFLEKSFALKAGSKRNLQSLAADLIRLGYSKSEMVEDPGSFSLRGGIADIFSPHHEHPCRIEFFDTEVESLRFYNPETQRTLDNDGDEKTLNIIPVREFDCSPENLLAARERIRTWSDSQDLPRSSRERVSELLGQGIATPEMDYFLPLLGENLSYGYEYFPEFHWIWNDQARLQIQLEKFLDTETKLCASAIKEAQLVPPVKELYAAKEQLSALASTREEIFLDRLKLEKSMGAVHEIIYEPNRPLHLAEPEKRGKKKSLNVDVLATEIERRHQEGTHVLLAANAQSQLDRIAFLLSQRGIKSAIIQQESEIQSQASPRAHLVLGNIAEGFALPQAKLAIISEDEIFGKKNHQRRSAKSAASGLKHLDELQADELIVHAEHGIGRYKGLVTFTANGVAGDFVHLEYAGGAKLYLPIYRLELLQKYVGAPGTNTSLDSLGTQQFQRKKDKVKSAVKDIAAKLLRVHAERATRKGHNFSEPDEMFREFEAEFPYDETPDQLKAIQDTIEDMCSSRPMDRLICGDVGFGKTEVAIRAAFKASQDGKQVAILVPTTILAEQHDQTFSNRLREHPVRVASISRFKSRLEQKQVLTELAAGKVDIIIGTHRLLSKDVKFHDLGLLIIDEEQRFGVEHKEKLKELRATADVLTLTATPIPRTLHLAFMGLRDISVIQTPPTDRLSIKTHLASFDPELIKQVTTTELARGGQVFFIHNRVQTIGKIRDLLQGLLPQARIGVAHGQMGEGELEKVMLAFYHRDLDILLATTIIENGLDIPNANTIIVNRADTFGLSQLHQIRGRVGRSQTRASAYFLIPEGGTITDEARERLAVLQRFVELGSGYAVASHDLELRGGGDILGDAQSGHIADVGYDMYLTLLEEEIHALRGETAPTKHEEDVEIHAPFPALLPEAYIPDMRSRLAMYRRLSALDSEERIEEAKQELRDRYGTLPKEAEDLLGVLRLKLLLRRVGFKAIMIGPNAFTLTAGKDPRISPIHVLALVAEQRNKFVLSPEGKLTVRGSYSSLKSVYDEVRQLVDRLRDS